MPSPKDYMDEEHTYVKGYVRRKHIEEELLEIPETYSLNFGTICALLSFIISLAILIFHFGNNWLYGLAVITITLNPFILLKELVLFIKSCISKPRN
jgi:hypothetical protein